MSNDTRLKDFDTLRQCASGNEEALTIVDAGFARGATAGETALELIHSGAIVPANDTAWTAAYNGNPKLQHEFMSLENFLAFKRAEASGRLKTNVQRSA